MNKLYKIVKQIRIQVNLPWKENKGKNRKENYNETRKKERKKETEERRSHH